MAEEKKDGLTDDQILEKMSSAGIDSNQLSAVSAYLELGIEQNDGIEHFEEAYSGQYTSDEDFAREMAESTSELPEAGSSAWPLYCIDWEYAARELMMDYSAEGGYYFRNL